MNVKPNWMSIVLTSVLMISAVILFVVGKNEQAQIIMALALGVFLPQPTTRKVDSNE